MLKKPLSIVSLFFLIANAKAQDTLKQNVIIITTDGLRWQELFGGADSLLLFNNNKNEDADITSNLYWDDNFENRRKKLFPFIWTYIEKKGQIWGNRLYNNNIQISNPFHLSYPGYSEIFTGNVDYTIVRNVKKQNQNINIFEHLQQKFNCQKDIAVFGSWNILNYILHKPKQKFLINAGYNSLFDDSLSLLQLGINNYQTESNFCKLPTRTDMLTYTLAVEYLQIHHPKVLYISFGETDEFAHQGNYNAYLQHAHQLDYFISEIWRMINEDKFYKNNTSLFITTDHGRGQKNWTTHGPLIPESKQIWMIQLGKNVEALGEVKSKIDIYATSFANTIMSFLNVEEEKK